LIIMCGSLSELQAQNYNFSFSQSQQAYNCLASGTYALPKGQNWTQRNIHTSIGFHFSYNGGSYDSICLKPEGQVSFDGTLQNCISLGRDLRYKADTAGNFSYIRYQTIGSIGQRIFMLEFSKIGMESDPREYINVQLWLYEQAGEIELHYGPNSYAVAKDSSSMIVVGALSFQQTAPQNGYLIYGNPSHAQGATMSAPNSFHFLTGIPANGTVYTLTSVQ
jgi:hypothetical protein